MVALKKKTSSLHPSSGQEPEPSYSSRPPSYITKAPYEDSFGKADAIYPSSSSMQTGSEAMTVTPMAPPPAAMTSPVDPLSPMHPADADSSALEMVLNESLPTPPPLPTQPSGLERGLQISSRGSVITWGFSLPKILAERGVTKKQWKRFSHELKRFARMRMSQLLTVLACEVSLGLVLGRVVGHKMKKHNEHTNFLEAYQGGAMKIFEDRWNNNYFQPLGLQIRIEPPGMDIANISSMDVASSKLFRYQHKKGTPSPAPGIASKQGKKKEYRYQYKEGRYRMKAIRKGRIVVLPFKTTDPISSQPRTTSSETQDGQSVVRTTTRVHPSAQDFAYLNQTQSSDGGLERNPVLAQRLTWSHQRQSNAEGLYRGYSEDDAERAPSPARAPTTHWGGYH